MTIHRNAPEPAWRRYLRFWRPNAASDVNDELTFHLESTIDELVADGMSRDAAQAMAARRFGDVRRVEAALHTLQAQREQTMRRHEIIQTLKQDVSFALRQLRRSPGFTIVAVLTLALGIGANSAIFSVVYSVLLRPLPFVDANHVLALAQRNGGDRVDVPFGNYVTWRRRAAGFEAIGATWDIAPMTLTGRGDPTPIQAVKASASFWQAVFAPPLVGRYFTEQEDRAGAAKVVVLSSALWRDRFNADRSVIGRSVMLEGQPYTVVGVAPPRYIFTPPAEQLWIPLALSSRQTREFGDHELQVYGRLKRGVAPEAAVRRLTEIDTELAKENPHAGYDGGLSARPLIDSVIGDQRLILHLLFGAVGLVLLIACGNIANLLLARANRRRGEIAIRGALGASRGRIVMQLLTESVLLALAGAALGLAVAEAGMRFLVSSPVAIPRMQDASLNGSVLAFTLAVALLCAVAFGFVPAIRASSVDVQETLRDGGREARSGTRVTMRRLLVISELCVAQVLLIAAGLLIRSSMTVRSVPAGFDTRNLVVFSLSLPNSRYREPSRQDATMQEIEASIAAIPGVDAVARTLVAPIYGNGWSWTAFREGSDGHDAGAAGANMRTVSASYFETLRVPMLRGRAFTASDVAGSTPVAIVSRGLAERLYGAADPIGRRIGNGSATNPGWREIVGVAGDVHASGLADAPPLELYEPSTQWINPTQTVVIRTSRPPATFVPALRRAVAGIDPLLALSQISTMQQAIADQQAVPRFTTWLLTMLGVTGLLLAAIGVYGVIAYLVAQRTHEFGVRMALGASAPRVQGMVLRQGMMLAAAGVGAGTIVALAAARVLRGLMFGITPHDPITFLVVGGALFVTASVASLIPARRATRIDPVAALRGS